MDGWEVQKSVSKIEQRLDDCTTTLRYQCERKEALEFNRSADKLTATLKPVPRLKATGDGLVISYPTGFPKMIYEFRMLKNDPKKLSSLLGFYGTNVYFIAGGGRSMVAEVNSVELVSRHSDDCLRELCREIGLNPKDDWF